VCVRLSIVVAASVAGCKSLIDISESMPGLAPYRIEIQQGNFVSQDMIAKLKPGMSREQVRFVLGTPLLTDVFHQNRWDYVFYREYPNKTREERRISIYFESNRLVRVEGDVVPKGQAAPAASTQPGSPKVDGQAETGAATQSGLPQVDGRAEADVATDASVPQDEGAAAPVRAPDERPAEETH
jgi:outer membrane protein assembly factor BamE